MKLEFWKEKSKSVCGVRLRKKNRKYFFYFFLSLYFYDYFYNIIPFIWTNCSSCTSITSNHQFRISYTRCSIFDVHMHTLFASPGYIFVCSSSHKTVSRTNSFIVLLVIFFFFLLLSFVVEMILLAIHSLRNVVE